MPNHPKVPEWKQLAATTGMVTTLSLLLHSHGLASIWRTGAAIQAPQVHKYLGVDDDEQLLGWLYAGTRYASDAADRRPFDTPARIIWHTTGI
ncbi:nitroreductase family protein [[Kitasatospora] papulosa]|uniref:nitroreductase family protein n=1 Tax=[Kitasatospora] papulosa TaxID=1464011 RepID=UPI0038228674